jgi:peptidoglycan-N-acetylglucosamine deacetylase
VAGVAPWSAGNSGKGSGRMSTRSMHGLCGVWIAGWTLVLLVNFSVQAQNPGPWHGKKCAVVLTYDDALQVHLDNVVPLLDSLGFKATFYVPVAFPGFRARLAGWSALAKQGHELGNHTMFHPCDSRPAGREWVAPEYDLRTYTVRRMVDEVRMADLLLQSMDGRSERTFAYTCGDMKAGDSLFVGFIRELFPGARGVRWMLQAKGEVDLYDIGALMVSGESGDDLVRLVRKAIDQEALLVFLFHGVGGEHSINVDLNAHRQLLRFLKGQEGAVWVAPLIEVVRYLRKTRADPWMPGVPVR